MTEEERVKHASATLKAAAAGILATEQVLDASFAQAVDLILNAKNYLIVVGVGKSGQISQKLSSSFASTGTPSFFMHPTDASHGDLGMVTPGSVVLAISNSGESHELIDVLNFCKKNDIPVIGMTRNPGSTLGRFSTVVLRLPAIKEIDTNGLAPTTSTTNALALGDALFVVTMAERGFSSEDFGRHHPGGKLGRRLQSVEEWLDANPHDIPAIEADAHMRDVIFTISSGQNGCAAVIDKAGNMIGMITDGDLRRAMTPDFFDKTAQDIMIVSPKTLTKDLTMSTVIDLFTEGRISNAFVTENGKPIGIVHMKALLRQGYI